MSSKPPLSSHSGYLAMMYVYRTHREKGAARFEGKDGTGTSSGHQRHCVSLLYQHLLLPIFFLPSLL